MNSSSALAGSIAATRLSANTVAGFSIVKYQSGSAGSTVAHGLGYKPAMIIVKSTTITSSWAVYHAARGATKWILINSTSAETTSSQEWNNVEPTTSVFSVGATNANSNYSGATNVAYIFSGGPNGDGISGYSRFGSYTGNGSTDGPFVFCGFRPRYVMIKRAVGGAGSWEIYDAARRLYNPEGPTDLQADTAGAENASTITIGVDFLANGFKVRDTTSYLNTSTDTYIFVAFSESPFGGSNVAPAPAR